MPHNPFLNIPMPMSCLAAAVLMAIGSKSLADDELSVQVVRDRSPAQGVAVVLDGDEARTVGSNGMVFFDLRSGQHSIQLTEGDSVLHAFRFSAAREQLADVTVDLSDSSNPRVQVESYNITETAEQRVQGATGTVQGQVTADGAPVAGATVELIDGVTRTAQTGPDGNFSIEAPRGVYSLVVDQNGYGAQELTDFRVVANAILGANFRLDQQQLASSSAPIEEVVVVGSSVVGGQQQTERFSVDIVDALDASQIARFGDSEISSSVLRIPAVTVQDGKYVFVRGLGGRYVSTKLNGASMPSTDPTKRTVPLDLFPSSMVEQLDISKSFSASSSGESTGGEVRIETKTFPTESTGNFSIALGYRDSVSGEDVWSDPLRGDWDVVGADDGSRARPAMAFGVAQALAARSDFTDFPTYDRSVEVELQRIGAEAIMSGFDLERRTADPDMSLSVNYGDLKALDDLDADFGYFVAASLKNHWQQKTEGISRTYEFAGGSGIKQDYTFSESNNQVDFNGLVALGFNIGSSSYESNTIVNRSTSKLVRRQQGIEGETKGNATEWSIQYEERQFASQQFTGNHILGDTDQWSVDWQGTVSQARRYAPDRRDVLFLRVPGDTADRLYISDVKRLYEDLIDDNIDISSDVEYLFTESENQPKLSFGIQAISRERDADADTYGFVGEGALFSSGANASSNFLVSDVLNSENITGDPLTGIAFRDFTVPLDSYEAEMDLSSAYVSFDSIYADNFQVVVGVRHEQFEQTTDTADASGDPLRSILDEGSTLPSVSLNWFYGDDAQIRIAASQTVARPDFKETTNALFYDREFGFFVKGNPNLGISDINNFDIRWEKYLSSQESVSVALFFKDLKNPIERVLQYGSGSLTNTRTFQNAESADISGIEIDLRKEFSLNDSFTRSIFMAFNASLIDSEVKLLDGRTRALQGAPDYSVNLIIGYDDISSGHEITLLFNQSGDTIVDVGLAGLADIIQEPRLAVDLNYKYYVSDNLTFKFQVEDLLDAEVEYTQGGNIFQSYKNGQKLEAGVDWSF